MLDKVANWCNGEKYDGNEESGNTVKWIDQVICEIYQKGQGTHCRLTRGELDFIATLPAYVRLF